MRWKLVLGLFLGGWISLSAKECRSDYECGMSQKCVKTGYDYIGICVDVTDSFGNKQYNYYPNPKSIQGNDGKGDCRYDNDCQILFKCYRANPYDIYGYCIKK